MTDRTQDDGMDDALAALQADYAVELPRMVAALGALVVQSHTTPEAAARARVAAHRIRGTAGSFGFPAVGTAAGEVEDAIDEAPGELLERMRALERLVGG